MNSREKRIFKEKWSRENDRKLPSGWTKSSQQRQLVDGRVELEVRREEFRSPWVDETIRLSDGDVCNPGNVPDFCGSIASSPTIRSDSQSPANAAVASVI